MYSLIQQNPAYAGIKPTNREGERSHFHVKNNDCFGNGAHEAGHLLEKALIDKYNEPNPERQWNKHIKSSNIVNSAWDELKHSPSFHGLVNKKVAELDISEYALQNAAECMAEAVADYSINGESAAPLSKAIWEKLKEVLK